MAETFMATRRILIAFVVCLAVAKPLMELTFATVMGRDFGQRIGVRLTEMQSEFAKEGKSPSRSEAGPLADEVARQTRETTDWCSLAVETSVVQFAVLAVLWMLISGEWRVIVLLPLGTALSGNVLSEDQVRTVLTIQEKLLVVGAQVVVCYASSALYLAIAPLLRGARRLQNR